MGYSQPRRRRWDRLSPFSNLCHLCNLWIPDCALVPAPHTPVQWFLRDHTAASRETIRPLIQSQKLA